MKFSWTTALALSALAFLSACGGGADRTKANVRLVNASSGYATLDLRVDDKATQTAVGYGATAAYAEADPGEDMALFSSSSATALLSFTPPTAARKHYTVLAYGVAGALRQLVLDDNSGAPDTNRSFLRVVNAAPDAGALDVYITGSGDTLADTVPSLAGATLGTAGAYLNATSGTWRLRITAANSKTDVRLDVPAITFTSKQVATLVLTPSAGGVLVKALLLNQQGTVDTLVATQARVRVVAGVTDAASVSVRLAELTLADEVSSPAVADAYQLVESGLSSLVVAVNGVPQPPTAASLVAGLDYTLLVYGTPAAPVSRWVTDDNNLSSDSSLARVRLVNGVSGLSTPLALKVNGASLASGLVAGNASAYATLRGAAGLPVEVTTTGVTKPLFSVLDKSFSAAANYTVFVLGDAESPAGVIRQDR